ncbi:MAG: hypothetical protein E7403_04790 [Ruminococcaceae bacterium]|nr:hypothetical protein [Oscillospiraceae bacterium]
MSKKQRKKKKKNQHRNQQPKQRVNQQNARSEQVLTVSQEPVVEKTAETKDTHCDAPQKIAEAVPAATHSRRRELIMFCAGVLVAGIICAVLMMYLPAKETTGTSIGEETISDFHKKLSTEVDALSTDGKKFVLDESYYREETAVAYIAAKHRVAEESITSEQIKDTIGDLFVQVPLEDGTLSLVQKEWWILLEESDNVYQMNLLDYRLLGTEHPVVTAASKGKYISQNDPALLSMEYGTSNLSEAGCGPICLTMAINYVTDAETVQLEQVAQWAMENNMYETNKGTKWSCIRNFPRTVSVQCEELYISRKETLEKALSEGQVLITSMKKGHFTENGHFIVIREITDEGVSVLDPASLYRSMKKWDIQDILDESNRTFWRIYQ